MLRRLALGLGIWLASLGLAFGQPFPVPGQCVSQAIAGGTSDALTIPLLPCTPTSTLLILTPSLANATTSPTLAVIGGPDGPKGIFQANGTALGVGALQPNSLVLLTYNGANWLLLSPSAWNGVWLGYTPTLTCGTGGPLTSASAAGRFALSGKTAQISILVTITTNGSCATALLASLPFTAGAGRYGLVGWENSVTGKEVIGKIGGASTTVSMQYYDSSYPGGNGTSISVSGTVETN